MRILLIAVLVFGLVACGRVSHSAPLDRLASDLAARFELECSGPHFENADDPLAARLHRRCSNARQSLAPMRDTLVIISWDSAGHALSVTRGWLPAARASEFAALRTQLTAEYGAPTRCESEFEIDRWGHEDLSIAIDTSSPGSGIRWGMRLRLGREMCATTP